MEENSMIYIFTPTFNRKKELKRLYASLVEQDDTNFIWLVIDDGSTDNTDKQINSWINEGRIKIEYVFQNNGGKYRAFNTALDKVWKYWNICVDSDDWLLPNSIRRMNEDIRRYKDDEAITTIAYPHFFPSRNLVNIQNYKICRTDGLYQSQKKIGITEVEQLTKPNIYKDIRFPDFENETFASEEIICVLKAKIGDMVYIPRSIVGGEYLEDGLTDNLTENYKKNPKGYFYVKRALYEYYKTDNKNFWNRIIQLCHIIALNFALNKSLLNESPNKFISVIAAPLGVLFYLKKYILHR